MREQAGLLPRSADNPAPSESLLKQRIRSELALLPFPTQVMNLLNSAVVQASDESLISVITQINDLTNRLMEPRLRPILVSDLVHLPTCGTAFRGCDPMCPKDVAEHATA